MHARGGGGASLKVPGKVLARLDELAEGSGAAADGIPTDCKAQEL
jgi:hypothetical protein